MDLQNLDLASGANKGATMAVEHPITGEVLMHNGKEAKIHVLGLESDVANEYIRQQAQKNINRRTKMSYNEAETGSINMLAKMITGWENIIDVGVEVEFNVENARNLLTKYKWLRQQVDAFVSDRANFFNA